MVYSISQMHTSFYFKEGVRQCCYESCSILSFSVNIMVKRQWEKMQSQRTMIFTITLPGLFLQYPVAYTRIVTEKKERQSRTVHYALGLILTSAP